MFSIRARKAMLAGAGVIVGFLASFFVLNIFNLAPDNSDVVVRVGVMALFVVVGAIAGLVFEKSTRARYFTKIESNPQLQQKIENAYARNFKIAWVISGIYLLWNIWNVYHFFVLGAVLSPTAHLQLILELIFNIAIVLVSLWVFFERGQQASTSKTKKFFTLGIVFFSISALINGAGFLFLKSSPQTLANVFIGQGNVVSLGSSATPLGEVSAMLPSGFELGNTGQNQIVIQPTTASGQSIASSLITIAVVSTTPEEAIANIEINLASQGYSLSKSTTTFLGYPAQKISSNLRGSQPGSDIAFEADGYAFVIGVTEAGFPTDAGGQAIMNSLDDIASSISIGNAASSTSDSGIITLATTMPTVTLPLGSGSTTMSLSMTVPPEYTLAGGPGGGAIFTVPARSGLGIGFYSIGQVGAENAGQQTLMNSVNNWTSQDAQLPINEATGTFLGYPAYIFTAQNDKVAKTILFQVPGATNFFEVEITYGSSDLSFENAQLDAIVNSVHFISGPRPAFQIVLNHPISVLQRQQIKAIMRMQSPR